MFWFSLSKTGRVGRGWTDVCASAKFEKDEIVSIDKIRTDKKRKWRDIYGLACLSFMIIEYCWVIPW